MTTLKGRRAAKAKKDADYERGWTPRLRGVLYCSPLCGCACTKAEHDQATKAGAALAKVMGAGWEPRIWENGGWHYSVSKGVATIHVSGHRLLGRSFKILGYWADIKTGGRQFIGEAKDPEDAYGFAIQDARGAARAIEADLADLANE